MKTAAFKKLSCEISDNFLKAAVFVGVISLVSLNYDVFTYHHNAIWADGKTFCVAGVIDSN